MAALLSLALGRYLGGESVGRAPTKCARRHRILELQSGRRISRSRDVNIRPRTVGGNCASSEVGTARVFLTTTTVVTGENHRRTSTIEFGHKGVGGALLGGASGNRCH